MFFLEDQYYAISKELIEDNVKPLTDWKEFTSSIEGFELINGIDPNTNKFRSNVYKKLGCECAAYEYKNSPEGEINVVIAYGPNNSDSGDILNNLSVVNYEIPTQFVQAYEFYTKIKADYESQYPDKTINFNFTGWSQGGMLAQLMGAVTGGEAVTFSAPGMSYILENPSLMQRLSLLTGITGISADPNSYTNIKNYVIMNDPIANFNSHIGETYLRMPEPIDDNWIGDIHQDIENLEDDGSKRLFDDKISNIPYLKAPDNWDFKNSIALVKYDVNFDFNDFTSFLNVFTDFVLTGESDLQESIKIINSFGIPEKQLNYSANFNDYIIDTKEDSLLEGIESVLGIGGNDQIYGNGGNDTIRGYGGDDIINGGTGNDKLYGGEGYDTYVFEKGDGQDVIIDSDGKGKIVIKDPEKGNITLYGTTDLCPMKKANGRIKTALSTNGAAMTW